MRLKPIVVMLIVLALVLLSFLADVLFMFSMSPAS
jgi:hypothetical protein